MMIMMITKTPSKMDVAPWNVHWIRMVLDGIAWYLMVFNGTRWYHMVFMVLDDIGCYSMVSDGI